MKYVYGEGVVSRSKHNPKVQSGELPRRQPTIVRETWIPWQYWVYRLSMRYFHVLRRWVPPLRGLIDQVWEEWAEWRFAYRPVDQTVILITWDQTTPRNRARHKEWVDDGSQARPADPRPQR